MLNYWCGDMAGAIGWLEKPLPPEPQIEDCGGNGHILFDSGIHAFILGPARAFYIFQFDLAFSGGRIQIGNDIQRVFLPGPSKHYAGFTELFESPGYELTEPSPAPMVYDLTRAIENGTEPVMSVSNAIMSFKMGLALFQSEREGNRLVRTAELDKSLRITSI
jgi:hypothetical protein